jgi:ribosome-associated translation inhibitor RaiA
MTWMDGDGMGVPAHVRVDGPEITGQDREAIARRLHQKLDRFSSSIARITVRLSDANGPKGGVDQICQVTVVLRRLPAVVVHDADPDVRRAIDRAIDAAALAVGRSVQRRRLKRLHHRVSPPPFNM